MLKRALAPCLVATCIALPALAQTTTAPATPAPGATTMPATGTMGSTAAAPMGGTMQFIPAREPGQYRASELIGRDVYGSTNEDIGEINDVLINASGQVTAVILGVGGFLGIGEKDVAVPMNALQFQMNNAASTTGTTAPPATTGTVPSGTTGTAAGTSTAARAERIMVNMTRDQLRQAPVFRDDRAAMDRTTAPATTAPAPASRP